MEQPTSGKGGSQKLDFLDDMPSIRGGGSTPISTKQKHFFKDIM